MFGKTPHTASIFTCDFTLLAARLRFNPVIPLTALAIGKDAAGRCAWAARESHLGWEGGVREEPPTWGKLLANLVNQCGIVWELEFYFNIFFVFSYSCHVGAVNESRGLYPASKDHIVGYPRMDCIHWRSSREPRVGSCWRILKHFPVRIYCTFPNLPWDDYPSGSTSSPAMAMVWARQEKSFYSVKV
jgi:hypothetical protein